MLSLEAGNNLQDNRFDPEDKSHSEGFRGNNAIQAGNMALGSKEDRHDNK